VNLYLFAGQVTEGGVPDFSFLDIDTDSAGSRNRADGAPSLIEEGCVAYLASSSFETSKRRMECWRLESRFGGDEKLKIDISSFSGDVEESAQVYEGPTATRLRKTRNVS